MQIILVLHNLIRWVILLFGLWTVLSGLTGLTGKKIYGPADSKANFFFMLSCDIQLLLGLALYIINEWYTRLKVMGETMKDANSRFFTIEHTIMMIVAIVLVHVGRVSVKKALTSHAKYKRTVIYFGLAILLIIAAIPWPFREDIARPLYRWFA